MYLKSNTKSIHHGLPRVTLADPFIVRSTCMTFSREEVVTPDMLEAHAGFPPYKRTRPTSTFHCYVRFLEGSYDPSCQFSLTKSKPRNLENMSAWHEPHAMSGGQETPHGMHLPRGFLMKADGFCRRITERRLQKGGSLNQLQEVIGFVEVDFSGTLVVALLRLPFLVLLPDYTVMPLTRSHHNPQRDTKGANILEIHKDW